MKLFYRTLGEGQPLIILHGLFGSADNWQTHAKKLSEYFKVYLVDQRNHGHSPHASEIDYNLMANDLYELVAEEGLRDILLLGHSMGGKTILRFAQQYNFLIDKIIVADMGVRQYPPHHDMVFKGLFEVDVDNCPSRKEAEIRVSEFVKDEGTKQFLMKNLYWKTPEKLAWRFNLDVIYSQRDNLMKAIPSERIEAHTLFLRGELSNYVLDEDMPSILEIAPNATFETINGAGHWLHAEAPTEFLERSMAYFGI